MARTTPASRAGRTLVIFFMTIGVIYGLVAIAGTLEARAGPRPAGRHPHHADRQGPEQHLGQPRGGAQDHRPARQRLRRDRGRGDDPGQPLHRRRDPGREPGRPGGHRQAPGAAAVPGGRADRRRHRRRPVDRLRRAERPAVAAVGHRPGEPDQEAQGRRRRRRPRRRTARRSSPTSPRRPPTLEPTSLPAESAERVAHRRRLVVADGQPDRRHGDAGSATDDPLTWMVNPDAKSLEEFAAFQCPAPGEATDVDDDPAKPLITCDENGVKYLLSAALIEGTQLSSASLLSPNGQQLEYGVNLEFNGEGADEFGRISDALYGTDRQFAIVLDGEVISAPVMNAPIHDGKAQITGSFTQAEADSLATSLKFGALPIQFQSDPPVETVGPSLAGNQLSAGITAGLVGLAMVMLYCLHLLPRPRARRRRLAARRGCADLRPGAAAQRGRRLHALPAGYRGTDRGGGYHRGLVRRVLRTHPRRDAGRQVDADRGRGGLGPGPEHLPGGRRGLAAGGRGALHLRGRRGEGLRLRARPVDRDRPRGLLLVHPPDGDLPGAATGSSAPVIGCRGCPTRRSASTGGPRSASPWEGGPDGSVLTPRKRALRGTGLDRLRRSQVALVLHLRGHLGHVGGGPLLPGPRHGHRVHRRRGVPRQREHLAGHPGHRRRAAGRGRRHGHRRRGRPGGDHLGQRGHPHPDGAADRRRERHGRRHDPRDDRARRRTTSPSPRSAPAGVGRSPSDH